MLISNFLVQLTPCYGEETFHCKRVLMFVGMIVFGLGLIFFCRVNVATSHEIKELYGRVYWGMISLAVGFFFYVTHLPERKLTSWFGKSTKSRKTRE
jgi:predicted membrane channel-forming protein YqfA (hemolysin III family)